MAFVLTAALYLQVRPEPVVPARRISPEPPTTRVVRTTTTRPVTTTEAPASTIPGDDQGPSTSVTGPGASTSTTSTTRLGPLGPAGPTTTSTTSAPS